MKKKKILLSLLCVGAVLGTASCKVETETPTPTPTTPEVVPTNPETGSTPTTPVVTSYKATLVYNNGAENGSIDSVEDGGKYYFDKPTDPTKQYHKFVGWYTDEALTQPFNFNSEVSVDITLYAKFVTAYDTVNTIWDLSVFTKWENPNLNSKGGIILGEKTHTFQNKFIVEANKNTYFLSDALNTQGCEVKFILSGSENTNTFTLNASYGSSEKGFVVIKNAETGEELYKVDAESKTAINVTKNNLPAGTYIITAEKNSGDGASLNITALSVGEQLPQGPTSGISISSAGATTNFLKGRAFNAAGLNVTLDYENGRKDVLTSDKYTVSAVDMTTAGKKTVTITYQLNATTTYTDTYEVVVWEAKSLNVYNYIYKDDVNNHARYVYFADETEKSVENITVKALCEAPNVEGTYEFKLNSNEYTIDKTNTDKIEFTYGDLDAEFNYVTVAKVDLSAAEKVTVSVNPSSPVSVNNDGYNFHTIMQAIQFLELAKVSDDAIKTIELKADTIYKEKVEISLPNVVLTTKYTDEASIEHAATIEYNTMAGDVEPGEDGIYKTDGSATVSVRKEAEGFKAEYIKFVHSCNTYEEYLVVKGKMKDTQGVAVLVQADKSQFINCYFSGYQDTLYAQVGRQYYQDCYIEGHTDFICGDDATAYFNGCTIYTINGGENQHNGGYVVSTKGNPKKAIEFGYIFDNCKFDADSKTNLSSVSLARGWDKNMTMAIINSLISGHYSKEAYGYKTPDNPATEDIDESKKDLNDRYGKMDAAPVASQLVEYNNRGDGAITASITDTCTVLTAEQAAKYTPANIFTANNGGTEYKSSWNPLAKEFAKLIIKNTNDEVLLTIDEFAELGAVATEAEYKALINLITIPNGKTFGGFYADKECSTKHDITDELSAENVIYAKWNDASILEAMTINFDDLAGGEITTEIELANGLITIVGSDSAKITVDGSSKSYSDVNGNTITSTNRLKLGGTMSKNGRYIILDLSNYSGDFKVTLNALSSSSSTNRVCEIKEGSWDGTKLNEVFDCPGTGMGNTTLTIQGGKVYYLGSPSSGINLYSINIAPVTE